MNKQKIEKLKKQSAELAKQAEELEAHDDHLIGQMVRKKLGDFRPADLIAFGRVLDQVSNEFDEAFSNFDGKYEPQELKIFDDPSDRSEIRADLKKLFKEHYPDEKSEEKTDEKTTQLEEKTSAPTGEQIDSNDGQPEENNQPDVSNFSELLNYGQN